MPESSRTTYVHPKHLAAFRTMVTESIAHSDRTLLRLTQQLRNAETEFLRAVIDNRRNNVFDYRHALVEKKKALFIADVRFTTAIGESWKKELEDNQVKLSTRPFVKKTTDDEVRAGVLIPLFSSHFDA